ncbi:MULTISPECIES: hypothetical protein [Sinorhizobium/Ensifer group]|uniref:hypothetical protein n=1 Tax=Sinorhizobium/Ensifer group TaxID=227292 RepID=UPI00068848F2|nr:MULTISPECIES: hypothetical protein [Sinorhizobium/Ensifer group]ASY74358.1 hypothetical protein SF83666_d69730 [Sinorhizobium fredii CCBAU 83666]NRQ18938.1 hypothetical protein [Ensifer sesbaniae]
MTVDLTAANNLPPRSDELFRIFARFELALKMARYCRDVKGSVEITWDSFANSKHIGTKFLKHVRDSQLCPTILSDPPKPEVIDQSGAWGFAAKAAIPVSTQDLFGAVRRVRNNLFHGGKYFDSEPKRDAALVAETIAVLLLAAEWEPDVNFFFEGRA